MNEDQKKNSISHLRQTEKNIIDIMINLKVDLYQTKNNYEEEMVVLTGTTFNEYINGVMEKRSEILDLLKYYQSNLWKIQDTISQVQNPDL